MIGYTVDVTVYSGDGDEEQAKALLMLDQDTEPPTILQLTVTGDNDVLIECDVADAYEALFQMRSKCNELTREWEHQQAGVRNEERKP